MERSCPIIVLSEKQRGIVIPCALDETKEALSNNYIRSKTEVMEQYSIKHE